jgi:hypothetical protein
LREALAVANNGDTINATRVSGTIFLTSGTLQITHSVHINGPGAGNLAVVGRVTCPVVFENFASDVTISGFTITNSSGDGILNQRGGLTVSKSSVVFNAGVGIGNSINFSSGATLTITNCTISGNFGAGISSGNPNAETELTVKNCTISGNFGGGITSRGIDGGAGLTVKNCTISGNSGNGITSGAAGIEAGGASTVAISDSTISGNSGDAIFNAVGLHAGASVSVKSCTISGNSGGGIYNDASHGFPGFERLELGSTILKAGSSGENIFNNRGTVTSLGYNLSTDHGGGFLTGPGDQINTNPLLGPLRDNGGPTFTHALLPGSPAINAGGSNFTGASFDQRGPGYHRVVDGRIDIGSFEVQATPTPTPTAP